MRTRCDPEHSLMAARRVRERPADGAEELRLAYADDRADLRLC